MTTSTTSSATKPEVVLPLACAPHVDASTLTLDQVRMILAIKVKTDRLRQALRKDPLWSMKIDLPGRGFHVPSEPRRPLLLCDQLPWPALLTLNDCAEEAAALAKCSFSELLTFAISICPYEHYPVLLQHFSHKAGILLTAKVLSPYIQGLRRKEASIKDGARKGATKSAQTRRKQSKVPAPEILKQEAQKLIDSHYSKSDVAGILAKRYDVTPTTIRRKLAVAK